MGIKDEEMTENKELANWIYYEEGDLFYCSGCIEKRLAEINENKEFSSEINYEAGDNCDCFSTVAGIAGNVFGLGEVAEPDAK